MDRKNVKAIRSLHETLFSLFSCDSVPVIYKSIDFLQLQTRGYTYSGPRVGGGGGKGFILFSPTRMMLK